MAVSYDYLVFELSRGRASATAFVRHIRSEGAKAIASRGGDLVGLFAPQLGFASNEMTALVCWHERREMPAEVKSAPHLARMDVDHLNPTVRPREGDQLRSAGIYVHRWFTIDGGRSADFIDLSNRAWSNFEGSYDTQIFGLFAAEPSTDDTRNGQARLLLLTWYRSHAVWEASREQAHDTASLFAKRHELTHSTIGRSSILVAE